MKTKLLADEFGGIWKEYPSYPGYFFSSCGKAASIRVAKPRLLIGCECGLGYRAISIPVGNGTFKRLYIHRAVCELFNGPASEGKPHVRHLDGDMQNNHYQNLMWGTPLENMDDMRRHGRTGKGERNPMAKLTQSIVAQMKKLREETGKSYRLIGQEFGVSTMTAFRAITGEAWA